MRFSLSSGPTVALDDPALICSRIEGYNYIGNCETCTLFVARIRHRKGGRACVSQGSPHLLVEETFLGSPASDSCVLIDLVLVVYQRFFLPSDLALYRHDSTTHSYHGSFPLPSFDRRRQKADSSCCDKVGTRNLCVETLGGIINDTRAPHTAVIS